MSEIAVIISGTIVSILIGVIKAIGIPSYMLRR